MAKEFSSMTLDCVGSDSDGWRIVNVDTGGTIIPARRDAEQAWCECAGLFADMLGDFFHDIEKLGATNT